MSKISVGVSVVDREDLAATAFVDSEGWCVITVLAAIGECVPICAGEPVTIVIVPARRETEEEWRRQVDDWRLAWQFKMARRRAGLDRDRDC